MSALFWCFFKRNDSQSMSCALFLNIATFGSSVCRPTSTSVVPCRLVPCKVELQQKITH